MIFPAGGGHLKEGSWNYTLRQHHPVSGKGIAGLEIIDEDVTDFMDRITAQAATVALSKDRRLLYARGEINVIRQEYQGPIGLKVEPLPSGRDMRLVQPV
jgi:hypothetical protein